MRILRETVRDVMEGGPGSGRHKGESGKERFIRGTIAGEIKGLRQYRRMRGFGITGIISNKKLQAAVKRMKLAYHEPSIYRIAGNLRRQAQSTNWGRIKQGKKVHEGGPGSGNFGHSGRSGERGGSTGKMTAGGYIVNPGGLRKNFPGELGKGTWKRGGGSAQRMNKKSGGITVIGKGGKPWPKAKEISPKEINPRTARAFRELQAKLTTPAPLPKDQLRHWRKKYVGYAKGLKSMGRTPFGFKSYVKANRPQSEGRKAVESLKEIIHNVMEYGVQGMKWGQRKETDVVVGKPIKVFGRHATAIGAPTRSGLQARYNTMKGRMKQIKSWKQHHVTPTYAAAYATTPKAAGSTYADRSFAAIRATYQRGTQFHRTAKTIGQQMKNIKIWMRHAKD